MSNLPELEGSEKQIKWAEDIRQRLIADNEDNEANSTLKTALTVTSAKWWIETRNLDSVRFVIAVGEIEMGESIWKSIAAGAGRRYGH